MNITDGNNNFLFFYCFFTVYSQTSGVTVTTANGCQSPSATTNLHTAMVSNLYVGVQQVEFKTSRLQLENGQVLLHGIIHVVCSKKMSQSLAWHLRRRGQHEEAVCH